MLSNAYFLAKFRFDTAENEPAKNLQNFRKMHFSKTQPEAAGREGPERLEIFDGLRALLGALLLLEGVAALRAYLAGVRDGIRQTLEGSFSAVSKPNFASKYAFESSRRDLHNALLCTAPKSHFFQKISRICQNLRNFKIFRFCEIRNFSNRIFAKNLRLQRCKRMQIL